MTDSDSGSRHFLFCNHRIALFLHLYGGKKWLKSPKIRLESSLLFKICQLTRITDSWIGSSSIQRTLWLRLRHPQPRDNLKRQTMCFFTPISSPHPQRSHHHQQQRRWQQQRRHQQQQQQQTEIPLWGPRRPMRRRRSLRSTSSRKSGTNCIKIGLPGKSILRD